MILNSSKNILTFFLLINCINLYSQEKDSVEQNNVQIKMSEKVQSYLDTYQDNSKNELIRIENIKKNNTINYQKKVEKEQKIIETIKEKREIDICYQRDKVDGVKIKVGITKTIEEANNLKRQVMMMYPYLTTPEVKDVRPNYYIMFGDYFSRNAAQKHLKEVQKKFPNAVLTNWRIYCRKAIPHGK